MVGCMVELNTLLDGHLFATDGKLSKDIVTPNNTPWDVIFRLGWAQGVYFSRREYNTRVAMSRKIHSEIGKGYKIRLTLEEGDKPSRGGMSGVVNINQPYPHA